MGVLEVCEEVVSEYRVESASVAESELVEGDDEKNCELRLACVSVIVSEFVSEASSVALLDAVSVE